MTITLQAAGAKDVGQVREANEDDFFFKVLQSSHEEPVGLFIVADGMGGHEGGEYASEWAVKTIRDGLRELSGTYIRQCEGLQRVHAGTDLSRRHVLEGLTKPPSTVCPIAAPHVHDVGKKPFKRGGIESVDDVAV